LLADAKEPSACPTNGGGTAQPEGFLALGGQETVGQVDAFGIAALPMGVEISLDLGTVVGSTCSWVLAAAEMPDSVRSEHCGHRPAVRNRCSAGHDVCHGQ
jgi:hypothetical protein